MWKQLTPEVWINMSHINMMARQENSNLAILWHTLATGEPGTLAAYPLEYYLDSTYNKYVDWKAHQKLEFKPTSYRPIKEKRG